MTYEETLSRFMSIGNFCDDYSDVCDCDCKKCDDMKRIIIEALEKQIPKKMVDNTEQVWFECPTCGRILISYYAGKRDHCKCGQAINWRDE